MLSANLKLYLFITSSKLVKYARYYIYRHPNPYDSFFAVPLGGNSGNRQAGVVELPDVIRNPPVRRKVGGVHKNIKFQFPGETFRVLKEKKKYNSVNTEHAASLWRCRRDFRGQR